MPTFIGSFLHNQEQPTPEGANAGVFVNICSYPYDIKRLKTAMEAREGLQSMLEASNHSYEALSKVRVAVGY